MDADGWWFNREPIGLAKLQRDHDKDIQTILANVRKHA